MPAQQRKDSTTFIVAKVTSSTNRHRQRELTVGAAAAARQPSSGALALTYWRSTHTDSCTSQAAPTRQTDSLRRSASLTARARRHTSPTTSRIRAPRAVHRVQRGPPLPPWWLPAPPQSLLTSCAPIRGSDSRGAPRRSGPCGGSTGGAGLKHWGYPRSPPAAASPSRHAFAWRDGQPHRPAPRGDRLCVPGSTQAQVLYELRATPLGWHLGRTNVLQVHIDLRHGR